MLYASLILLVVIVLLAFRQLYTARNYLGENEPFYAGNFAVESPEPAEVLTVVSYNISYGLEIERALIEIRELQLQRPLDILLLQEMEESGVEKMARKLEWNFVYYPAAMEPKYKRNFGNAVLSRWPIIDSQKVILPHISLSDRMKRIATRATIRIQDMDVVAYSLHTEPAFIWPRFKENQCVAVLQDPGSRAGHVVAGGDFNAFTGAYVEKIEKHYRQAGFVRASQGNGYTFVRFGIKMPPDQIFAKGFSTESTGKMADAKASDHLPVWCTLIP